MTKIELTISPDYVPNWTVVDAVRELFQNAVDQQEQYPDNKMSWEYSSLTETLTISNKSSELTSRSLLLGSTTKSGDKHTIGQFGEGYKIATLVLLRNGKNITFYNRKANEIWRPRLVDSRRFGTKVLTFFIEKCKIWDRRTNNDLTIDIEDISEDFFNNQISASNLHIRNAEVLETTDYGDILVDLPGQVFINGLFVCNYAPYKYGYNFKPECLTLDRDRKMASDFDLKWLASKIWHKVKRNEEIIKLIKDGAADVEYINNMGSHDDLSNTLFMEFLVQYGNDAIPVSNQSELENLPPRYRGIIVSSQHKYLISSADGYNEPESCDKINPLDELDAWFQKVIHKLDTEDADEFKEIYSRLCK
jgi:hypothetical protein